MTLLLALGSAPALAWDILQNHEGQELHWAQMPIAFSVNPDNDQGVSQGSVFAAVRGAVGAWEALDEAAISFSEQGQTNVVTVDHDEINAIYFDVDWTLDPELMAVTGNWATSDGTIIGFDIRINERDYDWATDGRGDAEDLQNMLTHEVGHGLGLAHSPEDPTATMYSTSDVGELIKREPNEDDRAAVEYLYGFQEETDTSEEVAGCSTTGRSRFGWAMILLSGVMFGRRRADS